MEPLGALRALGPCVALLAHAVARLVALLPLTAVRVAAWPKAWTSIPCTSLTKYMEILSRNPENV